MGHFTRVAPMGPTRAHLLPTRVGVPSATKIPTSGRTESKDASPDMAARQRPALNGGTRRRSGGPPTWRIVAEVPPVAHTPSARCELVPVGRQMGHPPAVAPLGTSARLPVSTSMYVPTARLGVIHLVDQFAKCREWRTESRKDVAGLPHGAAGIPGGGTRQESVVTPTWRIVRPPANASPGAARSAQAAHGRPAVRPTCRARW